MFSSQIVPGFARLAALAVLAFILCNAVAFAGSGPAAKLAVARLDCGDIKVNRGELFSDTYKLAGQSFNLVESCYLIRHGDDYVLWDTGLSENALDAEFVADRPISYRLTKTLADQLAEGSLSVKDISKVAISHYHPDHTGQAHVFTHAGLLIGGGDWRAIKTGQPGAIMRASDFTPWLDDESKVNVVEKDLDVFGDGSVVILATPGHTPGHRSLLLRLEKAGAIVISGDAAHLQTNLRDRLVPMFNTDRADSLASMDRLSGVAKAERAEIIIQHDPRDISKVSAFPEWTE